MKKPLLLDLFCCQGGASAGYVAAGFDVVGVDLEPQPRYPYTFAQMDAITILNRMVQIEHLMAGGNIYPMPAAIHASPPCQGYSNAQRIQDREHPMLIDQLRDLLDATGLPYVIENVQGAPLKNPVTLCGAMFGLHTYRHRLFETNFDLAQPEHPEHSHRQVKMGRPVREGQFYQAVGNFSNVEYARQDMGVPWMSRDGIRECIPPAYTLYVGNQLREVL